jgi:hypothetical protein
MFRPHKPHLCLSLIGGAKNFRMEGRKKEIFKSGLIAAAKSTNALILTGGNNTGKAGQLSQFRDPFKNCSSELFFCYFGKPWIVFLFQPKSFCTLEFFFRIVPLLLPRSETHSK